MKRRKIFICIFAVSLLINVIPLLIFKDKAAITYFSWFPMILMLIESVNGVIAFFLRHKGNYFTDGYRSIHIFSEDKDYTFTKEYKDEFFWQFCLYWFAVPFYIPCIFFVSGGWRKFLWTACVFFTPYLVYFIYYISKEIKAEKEYQIRKKKQEQELKEQMLREEMGHIK